MMDVFPQGVGRHSMDFPQRKRGHSLVPRNRVGLVAQSFQPSLHSRSMEPIDPACIRLVIHKSVNHAFEQSIILNQFIQMNTNIKHEISSNSTPALTRLHSDIRGIEREGAGFARGSGKDP
jgi:hypothetical protein